MLTCPRCGPGVGLILLAERLEERRVLEGRLGCPSCRASYAIRGGVAELRGDAERAESDADAGVSARGNGVGSGGSRPAAGVEASEAMRVAALLELREGRGVVLLVGPAGRVAGDLAALIEGIEVVVLEEGSAGGPETPGVSRLRVEGGLPFFGRSLRGVVVSGNGGEAWLDEAARVVAPVGRVLVEGPGPDAARRLRQAGLRVLAEEPGALLAARLEAL